MNLFARKEIRVRDLQEQIVILEDERNRLRDEVDAHEGALDRRDREHQRTLDQERRAHEDALQRKTRELEKKEWELKRQEEDFQHLVQKDHERVEIEAEKKIAAAKTNAEMRVQKVREEYQLNQLTAQQLQKMPSPMTAQDVYHIQEQLAKLKREERKQADRDRQDEQRMAQLLHESPLEDYGRYQSIPRYKMPNLSARLIRHLESQYDIKPSPDGTALRFFPKFRPGSMVKVKKPPAKTIEPIAPVWIDEAAPITDLYPSMMEALRKSAMEPSVFKKFAEDGSFDESHHFKHKNTCSKMRASLKAWWPNMSDLRPKAA